MAGHASKATSDNGVMRSDPDLPPAGRKSPAWERAMGKEAPAMSSCLEAFRFLTAIPLPRGGRGDEQRLASSVAWFPLVGLALGGILALMDFLWSRLMAGPNPLLPSALALTAYALLTGGMHHDGLLDAADAFWGRRSAEERLRVMKDSRAGALGVTALILVLLLELAALTSIPASREAGKGSLRWATILVFPTLGRWAMSYLCYRFPYARSEGTGAAMVGRVGKSRFLLSTLLTLSALSAAFTWVYRARLLIPALMLCTLCLAEILGEFFSRSLGGLTGDTVGAAGMLCEAFLLLLLASRVSRILAGG